MAGESRLWDRWQPKLVEHFFVQRIENLCGDGVPDVHLMTRDGRGEQAWVELKYTPNVPKRETTRVFGDSGLRAEQVAWIFGRSVSGGNIWILAGVAEYVLLVHGKHAREFNQMTLGELLVSSSWKHNGKLTQGAVSEAVHIISRA